MPANFRANYLALVAAGEIEADPAQQALVSRFERLEQDLSEHRLARKSSALGWLFGKR
jgi:cell division protein ZapE